MDRVFPYRILVTILTIGLLLGTGCTQDQNTSSGEENVATIGVVLPQTGPAGTIGGKAKEGLEVAESTLPVQVVYEDSRSTTTGGVNAFQSLLTKQDTPDAIISLMSSVGKALIPMSEGRQIATMHIASAPGIAKGHKYAFRWYITSDMQMEYLVDYLRKDNIESEKIAFLHLNDDYGKGSLQAFSKHLDSLGLDKKVFSESYQPDQSNFRSILAKVKNFNPDVIALVGYSSSLGTLVKQIRQLDIEAKLIGDDAVSYPQILSAAGSAANGFVFAGLPIENISKDKQFYKTYTDMFDKEPNDFSVFTYGAAKILSTCITADDYKGSDDLARCLSSNEFETPLGTVRFDKDHNGTVNLVLQTIDSGNVEMLQDGV